jgi:hypothetical protein
MVIGRRPETVIGEAFFMSLPLSYYVQWGKGRQKQKTGGTEQINRRAASSTCNDR